MLLTALSCAGRLDAQPTTTASSLSGVVYDSLAAQTLSGASVELVRQGGVGASTRTMATDSLGRFRFMDVRPGRYVLRFLHPALDRLGVEPSPRVIIVSGRTAVRANLAIPSPATLRLELCGEDALRDSLALIIGHTLRARDRTVLDSVIVTATWRRRAAESTASPEPVQRRRVAASSNGWFVICAARSGDAIQLAASRNTFSATMPTVTVPTAGVLQQDILLSDEPATSPRAPASAVTSAVQAEDRPASGLASPGALSIQGTVFSADGGRPIAGAIVGIAGVAVTRSDALGEWRLAGVRSGSHTVTVRAVRYTPLNVTISVEERMSPVRLVMQPIAAQLDTVDVRADREEDRVLAAFLERRRTRGSGTFLTEADIGSRRPTLTSDVFRSVQGGVTIERDSLGNRYLAMASNTFRSSRCLPSLFIDGMSMRGLTAADIDGLLRPQDLLGIEIYRAANAPAEFSEQDGCGSILVWTKK